MNPESASFYFHPRKNEMITTIVTGLVAATSMMVLAWVVSTYIIGQVICGDNTDGVCAQPFTLGYNIFLILSALAATGWFAYSRIFRPALITLPAVIMFWSLPQIFSGILNNSFFVFALLSVVLIALSYAAFYWIVRIRSFLIVALLWVLLTIGLRFMLVS